MKTHLPANATSPTNSTSSIRPVSADRSGCADHNWEYANMHSDLLRELARTGGVVSAKTLSRYATRASVRSGLRTGHVYRVAHGQYRIGEGWAGDARSVHTAAALRAAAARNALVSHLSAAAYYGLDYEGCHQQCMS